MKIMNSKTESETVQQSLIWWNVSRVSWLQNVLNVGYKELVKNLRVDDTITATQLKAFAQGKTDALSDEQVWTLHFKIDRFFVPWD